MILKISIPGSEELAEKLGIDKRGAAQIWHTQNVLRHMIRFMPMRTGMFATKQTAATSSTTIRSTAPHAYYLYYGKRMVNSNTGKGPRWIPGVGWRWPKGATLVATEDDLVYTTDFNPNAGPYWDQRMLASDGAQMAQELKDYVKLRGAK